MAIRSNASKELPSAQIPHFNSSLLSTTNRKFASFLEEKSETIKATLAKLVANVPASDPNVHDLQERLSALLAAEKSHVPELERIKLEKDQLQERLESAVSRYMLAEKKLDRARSAQVAKLEAQATAGSRPEGSSGQDVPDVVLEDGVGGAASEAARKEAVAVAEKRTEQLEKLVKENVKLTNDLTGLQTRLAALGDDDYANSELFKTLKSQHQDVIKRLNDLEAINGQLREEAKILQGERTAYREEADNELRTATIDMQSQLAQSEAEMLRVKHKRDEVIAELGIHRSTVDQHKISTDQIRELAEAREIRISALESEAERIRGRGGLIPSDEQLSSVDPETLRQRLSVAENEKKSLENELRSMEAAWKKASALANKKIGDIIDVEEKLSKYSAEKGKADQKYFASMKNNEAMKVEVKALRTQDMKSSEIISQLKETESSCRGLLINLEKQLAEVKDALAGVTNQYRAAQKSLSEQKVSTDRLTAQNVELNKKLTAKDASVQEAAKAQREAEVELTESKARLERTEKSLASWKKKGIGNQNEEFEMLRVSCCHLNSLTLYADKRTRRSPNAMFATTTGRIQSSRRVATFAAKSAWTSKSNSDRGNVLYAAASLGPAITCASHCDAQATSPYNTLLSACQRVSVTVIDLDGNEKEHGFSFRISHSIAK